VGVVIVGASGLAYDGADVGTLRRHEQAASADANGDFAML
jgi:hypothetical protein